MKFQIQTFAPFQISVEREYVNMHSYPMALICGCVLPLLDSTKIPSRSDPKLTELRESPLWIRHPRTNPAPFKVSKGSPLTSLTAR